MLARKIISILLALLIISTAGFIIWNRQNNTSTTTKNTENSKTEAQNSKQNTTGSPTVHRPENSKEFSKDYLVFLNEKEKYNKVMESFQTEFAAVQQSGEFTPEKVEELQQSLTTLKKSSTKLLATSNTLKTDSCTELDETVRKDCIVNFETYEDLITFSNDFLEFTIDTYAKGDSIPQTAVQANINKKVKLLNQKGKTYETAHTAFVTLVKGKKGFEEVQ